MTRETHGVTMLPTLWEGLEKQRIKENRLSISNVIETAVKEYLEKKDSFKAYLIQEEAKKKALENDYARIK